MMLGDADGARADYQAALEGDPRFAPAYANRGILRDRAGDTKGAMADYREALRLDPKLGELPGILDRILYNPPTDTIKTRLEVLEALQKRQQVPAEGVHSPD
jgi:tetratricopeptide (TPR) repeat protein